jgi:Holliday junction DNA helicase RuvA
MSYTREYFLQTQKQGEQVSLFTIFYIESNLAGGHLNPTMLGFTTETEREFFQLFTSVAKIGVKTALTAASIPVHRLAEAIEEGDSSTLKQLKGIGERTAHKIIASLKGKVTGFLAETRDGDSHTEYQLNTGVDSEVMQVLLQLGHSVSEAKKMIKDAATNAGDNYTTAELLAAIYRIGK